MPLRRILRGAKLFPVQQLSNSVSDQSYARLER
jgi:hypothetical protein